LFFLIKNDIISKLIEYAPETTTNSVKNGRVTGKALAESLQMVKAGSAAAVKFTREHFG
jgi:hypothetical protein